MTGPATEAGRRLHERTHSGVLEPCDYINDILAIEAEAAEAASFRQAESFLGGWYIYIEHTTDDLGSCAVRRMISGAIPDKDIQMVLQTEMAGAVMAIQVAEQKRRSPK